VLRNVGLPVSSLHFAASDSKNPLGTALTKARVNVSEADHAMIRGKWLDPALTQEYLARRVALSQNERRWLEQLAPLKIGFNVDWGAISSAAADGSLSGISGDFTRLLENRLGLRFAPRPARGPAQVLPLMRERKVDVAVVMSDTSGDENWLYTDRQPRKRDCRSAG